MAARTRPQLGSRPNTAHLNRLLRATERPTSTASASEAAPTTSTAMSCSEPSASRTSCWARSWQTAVTAAVSASGDGVVPDAPPASRTTVSLVDMHPSESSRSKVTRVAARSASSQVAASTSASVVRTTSIVASAGASMPAPLAMPPTTNPSPWATACFGTVSVVMIASAATAPPSSESAACAARTPSSRRSAGSGEADQPGGADHDVGRAGAGQVGDHLGGAVGGREAVRAGVAVGAAGVEHDGARTTVGGGLLAPQHGVRLAPVGRVDGSGDVARAGADDERDVAACRSA